MTFFGEREACCNLCEYSSPCDCRLRIVIHFVKEEKTTEERAECYSRRDLFFVRCCCCCTLSPLLSAGNQAQAISIQTTITFLHNFIAVFFFIFSSFAALFGAQIEWDIAVDLCLLLPVVISAILPWNVSDEGILYLHFSYVHFGQLRWQDIAWNAIQAICLMLIQKYYIIFITLSHQLVHKLTCEILKLKD